VTEGGGKRLSRRRRVSPACHAWRHRLGPRPVGGDAGGAGRRRRERACSTVCGACECGARRAFVALFRDSHSPAAFPLSPAGVVDVRLENDDRRRRAGGPCRRWCASGRPWATAQAAGPVVFCTAAQPGQATICCCSGATGAAFHCWECRSVGFTSPAPVLLSPKLISSHVYYHICIYTVSTSSVRKKEVT
jgi:hypothetical protein